jgi:hypothetical protein
MGFGKMFFVMLYSFVPLIVIPIISYHFGNWYLLFGVLFCYIGVAIASYNRKIFYFVLLFCLGVWTARGFHLFNYLTTFFLCFLWGYVCYSVVIVYNNKEIKANDAEDYATFTKNEFLINEKVEEYKASHPGIVITEEIVDSISMKLFINGELKKFKGIDRLKEE